MDSNWATDHLQVIRTLMERSAIYRRAMAPLMTYTGIVGVSAGVVGGMISLGDIRTFVVYWSAIAGIALGGSLVLVRRQALKDQEPFWSPPTRRVAQAMLPSLFVGAALGPLAILNPAPPPGIPTTTFLPELWMCLYGCALVGAGFFMHRGVKLLGWIFIILGILFWTSSLAGDEVLSFATGNLLMGAIFGGFHLAYGIYLFFTEQRRNEL